MLLFVSGTMESAVLAASRYGVTGFTEDGVSREDRIREIIADRTMGFVDLKTTKINTLVYSSFDQIGQPEPFTDANKNGSHDPGERSTMSTATAHWDHGHGQGGPGRAWRHRPVRHRVRDRCASPDLFEPIFGRVVHRAAVAVRNEPF